MLRIGLIGTGTVGGGVIQILEQKIAEYSSLASALSPKKKWPRTRLRATRSRPMPTK